MQGDKIHILSTGDIPAFSNPFSENSRIVLDVFSFQKINLKESLSLRQRVNELARLPYFAIFTSANAVRSVAGLLNDNLPEWKCFCVGEKSKKLIVQSMPDCSVLATADLANDLSKELVATRPSPLVFFSGNLRREELPLQLNKNNIPFEELVVYETIYTAVPIKQHYLGILFFSPGAVNAYFEANKPHPNTVLFAIGPTTESALHEKTNNKVLTTDRPDKAALVKLALEYFEAY
jgi:uroporphyrinogen-III synthase